MSQAKVDKYKQEKKNRKSPKKTSKLKKIIPYTIVTIVVLLFLGYLGISVAKQTGCYTPPTEPRSWSKQEVESLRQVLIQATDPNVQYTTVAPETPVATKKVKADKKADKTQETKAAKTEKTTKKK